MATTFKVVEFYRKSSNSLGFGICGGYSTDIPATIFDINKDDDEKLSKLEEGDIIVEINGINTRHLTINEINKQLRCCNRVILKVKSDHEYKSKFKELKDSNKIQKFKCDYENQSSPLSNILSIKKDQLLNETSSSSSSSSPCMKSKLDFINDEKIPPLDYCEQKSNDDDIKEIENENNNSSTFMININMKNVNNNNSPCAVSINKSKKNLFSFTQSSPTNTSSNKISQNINDISTNQQQYRNIFNNLNTNDDNLVESPKFLPTFHGTITTSQNGISNVINTTALNLTAFNVEIDEIIKKKIDEKLKGCESDSDTNLYTPKAVDIPSAQRLAKRLYYLDGFKVNDVVRHLAKKNDFNQLVADEYLKLFNFHGLTLDAALRKFLKQFQLVGDAQEKERVLMYFAKRYVDSNETAFNDVDTCHTLTCAIMLLNTDLHDLKIANKMSLVEFIENLKGLNDGGNFSEELLESLYNAIKNEPLECASIDVEDIPYDERVGNLNSGNNGFLNNGSTYGCNPFLQLPDPQTAKEYKSGWLLRKYCVESDGKRTPFLKRNWKMFYASLRDMVLYLHKDDKGFKNNRFDNISNAIRIHHAHASVANDYKKKKFVFRLKTADWAEYLFQTTNTNELNEWINIINLIAAMFSSPALASAVSSSKTFQRPLLPVSVTRYTLQEQYDYHKKHVKQLQIELNKLENIKDDKLFDKDKYNYHVFEVQRYTTYLKLLEDKISDNTLSATPPLHSNHNNNSIIYTNDTNNELRTTFEPKKPCSTYVN